MKSRSCKPADPGSDRIDFEILFEKKIPTREGRDIPGFLLRAGKLLAEAVTESSIAVIESSIPSVQMVSISSVVPACTPAAIALAKEICSLPPVVVSRHCSTGLSFEGLPAPDKIGADRIADAAWAAAAYALPVMTVDLGTATTINVVAPARTEAVAACSGSASPDPIGEYTCETSAACADFSPNVSAQGRAAERIGISERENTESAACRGVFLGGMIGAGVRTSLQALRSGTAQLPALEPQSVPAEALIGRDTDGCMLSASVVGTAAMIDGLALRVEEQLGSPLTLLLTGGNAHFVMEWIRHPFVLEPHLAAKGTALVGIRERHRGL